MKYGYRKFSKNEIKEHITSLTIKNVAEKLDKIIKVISNENKKYKKKPTEKTLINILSQIDALRNIYNELEISYSKAKAGQRNFLIEKRLENKARNIYFKKLLKKYKILP